MDIKADNKTDSIKLRRYSDRLVVCGLGYILFGAWDTVRNGTIMILERKHIYAFLRESVVETAQPLSEDTIRLIIYSVMLAFLVIFALISVLSHLFIGIRAIEEGRGRKKTSFYLLFTTFLLIMLIASHLNMSKPATESTIPALDNDTSLAVYVMDFSMALLSVELLYSAFRARLIKRRLG